MDDLTGALLVIALFLPFILGALLICVVLCRRMWRRWRKKPPLHPNYE